MRVSDFLRATALKLRQIVSAKKAIFGKSLSCLVTCKSSRQEISTIIEKTTKAVQSSPSTQFRWFTNSNRKKLQAAAFFFVVRHHSESIPIEDRQGNCGLPFDVESGSHLRPVSTLVEAQSCRACQIARPLPLKSVSR